MPDDEHRRQRDFGARKLAATTPAITSIAGRSQQGEKQQLTEIPPVTRRHAEAVLPGQSDQIGG
ncbi:MAG: hypothetical protein ACRESQ_09640 [Gammaproteobacteria bacterium]